MKGRPIKSGDTAPHRSRPSSSPRPDEEPPGQGRRPGHGADGLDVLYLASMKGRPVKGGDRWTHWTMRRASCLNEGPPIDGATQGANLGLVTWSSDGPHRYRDPAHGTPLWGVVAAESLNGEADYPGDVVFGEPAVCGADLAS
jgi:hypothetical protein